MPRSRSYWISKFLTYGEWTCAHEHGRHIRSLDDVKSWLSQDYVGAVDTAAASFWRIQQAYRPDARVAVIRRHPDDVMDSVLKVGLPIDRPDIVYRNIRQLDRKLDEIERRVPGVMRFTFGELTEEAACAELFEFCLEEKHDRARWAQLAPLNLQINLTALVRYELAHQKQMARAKEDLVRAVKRLAYKRRPSIPMEDFSFQQEDYEAVMRDGGAMLREHAVAAGLPADEILRVNMPMIQKLCDAGLIQIMTARSNGRLFGYLMTLMSPALDKADLMVAQQLAFYASPDARGIGAKLQRESINGLRQRGGKWRVVQRAGVRGDGPRLGTLFKRMGAEDFGHLYSLMIEEAA